MAGWLAGWLADGCLVGWLTGCCCMNTTCAVGVHGAWHEMWECTHGARARVAVSP